MKRSFCWTAILVAVMGLAACDSETIVRPEPLPANTLEARFSISSDPVRQSTPEEGIASITDLVGRFVEAGSLSKSTGYSLTVELNDAASALRREDTKDTINRMTNFVGVLCGIGTTPLCGIGTTPFGPAASTEVELLITSAQTVIDQLLELPHQAEEPVRDGPGRAAVVLVRDGTAGGGGVTGPRARLER